MMLAELSTLPLPFGNTRSSGPFGTRQLMRAQCRHHHRRQRDGALAGFRLGLSDRVEAVGALPHMQFAALEVDIRPAQAAQFGRAQAGEDRGQEQRPPASVQRVDQGADFVGRRDVDADLELALLALVGADFLAAPTASAQVADDVLSDKAALLSVRQDGAERAADFASPWPGSDRAKACPRRRAPSAPSVATASPPRSAG